MDDTESEFWLNDRDLSSLIGSSAKVAPETDFARAVLFKTLFSDPDPDGLALTTGW